MKSNDFWLGVDKMIAKGFFTIRTHGSFLLKLEEIRNYKNESCHSTQLAETSRTNTITWRRDLYFHRIVTVHFCDVANCRTTRRRVVRRNYKRHGKIVRPINVIALVSRDA